jgi:hypothetical protein
VGDIAGRIRIERFIDDRFGSRARADFMRSRQSRVTIVPR